MTPQQAKPAGLKSKEKTMSQDAVAPGSGPGHRLHQQVTHALAAVPGGQQLDQYFGISSGKPGQPHAEGQRSDELVNMLRAGSGGKGADAVALLQAISAHADSSGADAEALRALMRNSRKRKGGSEGC